MKKKEEYRRTLPHFQQPGQMYFVTSNLKNAIPTKALERYNIKLQTLRNEMLLIKSDKSKSVRLNELENLYYQERRRYMHAYDELLNQDNHTEIDLCNRVNLSIMCDAFRYFEGQRLENHAFCVMKNHFHWVVELYKEDENGNPVFLQDIMKTVKGVTANRINKAENKTGRNVWQSESFDVTIRNDKHCYNAVSYTVQNPVKAGLVGHWKEWKGTWCRPDYNV